MLTRPYSENNRRFTALALTVALHMVLLYGWHLSNRTGVDTTPDVGSRIQWLLAPKTEPMARATPPKPSTKPLIAPAPQRQAPSVSLVQETSPAPADNVAELAPESLPAPAMSVMERARSAVGGIDKALQEANKDKLIRAKPVSAQTRLERAMQHAHDMAPNKWYEKAKVTEVIDPGGNGRRRYRVVGIAGTYCVTIDSNRTPNGRDPIQHAILPKITNCPPDEQAETKQEW